jgi:hypothetical protein
MSPWLLFYPAFPFNRIIHYLSTECAFYSCFGSFDSLNEEFITCLICLYTTPWIYLILGMYLYEVIPQKFGVRKSPLFCFGKLLRRCRGSPRRTSGVVELKVNDSEVLSEISKVVQVSNERQNYPLIIEKLTKVCKIITL